MPEVRTAWKKFVWATSFRRARPIPAGSDRWQVIRIGADIKIKCLGCGRVVMMERPEFVKRRKKILEQGPVPEAETLRQMAGQFEGGTR